MQKSNNIFYWLIVLFPASLQRLQGEYPQFPHWGMSRRSAEGGVAQPRKKKTPASLPCRQAGTLGEASFSHRQYLGHKSEDEAEENKLAEGTGPRILRALVGSSLLISFLIFFRFQLSQSYSLMTVMSGSMGPTVKQGSFIIVKSVEKYQEGDIITFTNNSDLINFVTHRIYLVKNNNGIATFVTKGDANNVSDSKEVTRDQILGKTILAIPYLGYLISFAKTLPGLIIFIMIPAFFFICKEILKIKKEIQQKLNA